jgi:tetratricopeptide (TPR) repeat protein
MEVAEAAERLGVTHLVEGSAKFRGNRYRVTVRLLDMQLDSPVWQDQFNGSLDTSDAFELEESVATCVLEALRSRLPSSAEPRVERGAPSNGQAARKRAARMEPQTDPAAYVAYLKGRHAWFSRTVRGLKESLETFRECVRLDPRYARAHAAIADAYNLLGAFDYGVMPPGEAYPRALEAARTSLELDADLAQGHAALGNALMSYERDFAAAEEAFRTAIELEPTYSPARQWYSTLLVVDRRNDEALSQAALALELDPWAPFLAGNLARIYRFIGEPERAAEQFRHSIEISKGQFLPGFLGLALCEVQCGRPVEGLAILDEVRARVGDQMFILEALRGYALARSGRLDDARRVAVELKKARVRHYVPDEYFAVIYVGTGEYERAIDALRKADEAGSQVIMILGVEPLVAPLRGEPAFGALLPN